VSAATTAALPASRRLANGERRRPAACPPSPVRLPSTRAKRLSEPHRPPVEHLHRHRARTSPTATLGHRPAIAVASCTLPTAAFVTWPDPTHGHRHTMFVSPLHGQGSALRAPRDPVPPHTPRLPLRLAIARSQLMKARMRALAGHARRRQPTAHAQHGSSRPLPCQGPHSPCLHRSRLRLASASRRRCLRSLRRAHSPDLGLDTCTHRRSSP
jgi:hypothetical protein